MTKRLLELFCGTKSVGKVFEDNGYEVISLDYNKKFNPTHAENILTWDYTQYPTDFFDVIWASPDCTTFSLASGGKHRLKNNIYGFSEKAQLGNDMIARLIEILKYFKCKAWFMENPRGLLQYYPPLVDFIKEINGNRVLVYYSNYNWTFQKPTHIWSNLKLWNDETRPTMPEHTYKIITRKYDGIKKKIYYGFQTNPEERSKIPSDLIKRLYDII